MKLVTLLEISQKKVRVEVFDSEQKVDPTQFIDWLAEECFIWHDMIDD